MRYIIFSLLLFSNLIPSLAQQKEVTPRFSQTFIPDYIFEVSSDNWRVLGETEWRVKNNGEIIGTAEKQSQRGLFILDTAFQDVGFQVSFKSSGEGELGVIFRLEKSEEGMHGLLVSVQGDEVVPFRISFDVEGQEVNRERLRQAGGIWYRVAPPEDKTNAEPQRVNFPPRPAEPEDLPLSRPNTALRQEEWNKIEVFLDVNVIRTFLNDGREIGGAIDGKEGLQGYGAIALYMSGAGKVHFKDILIKDISIRETPIEESSPRFTVQRISDMYYSWAADAADFNKDGVMDVVAGPYIYYGPDYTKRREIFPAIAGSPSLEFPYNRVQDTYDFNYDGWPDVLSSAFSTTLYINPKGESRRWKSYDVLPDVSQSEITEFVDIDEDGRRELVYSGNGSVRYAKPNADDPTQPWEEYTISEQGYGLAHGIGTGDINGDGRIDILNPFGWWEQPDVLEDGKLWKYHPQAFGRYGNRSGGIGGSLMGVYDVNGDGLNDVVSNLNAHGFGLAWYEQHRDEDGTITFTRHMISDDFTAENAGGVTFSQPHGAAFADVDGDGILDFIVGKRYFTHLDNYYDPDPYGPPVLYWYKTVRNPQAPGGAEFVPELIHNRSGAGSEVTAVDLDEDGKVDVITSTNRGTFIFWNRGKE